MGKIQIQISWCVICLVCSLILNLLLVSERMKDWELVSVISWSRRAAEEGEEAAAVECSGHGRAYLDGLLDADGIPQCECNSCFLGPDCSQFSSHNCVADVDSGDPLFLEPFWMKNAASSAMLVAGWHRMSYVFNNQSLISQVLENQIRKLHSAVGNAVTQGRFIVFGSGSIHLLNAAIHALSPHNSSSRTKVVASIPFYPLYQIQTDFFRSTDFEFEGDTSLWKNSSDSSLNFIEIVTAPNNPDGHMNKAVLEGPYVKTIHDHAYYWPHFTAIPAPADEDLMLFSLSKLTGHAGTRFGWAVIKDEAVYERMSSYVKVNTLGISRDAQLRALKLVKVVMEGSGREIFEFGHTTMKNRWEKLSSVLSVSNRFSLQEIAPQYCSFFRTVRSASPAYAWLKCEREEDKECYSVLKKAGITGRDCTWFGVGNSYVRVSLITTQDDFDMLLLKINNLVAMEDDSSWHPKSTL